MSTQLDTASPLSDLNSFQRDALEVIAQFDDPHGLAIKGELERFYDGEVYHGRLYPNLDTLVQKGLVEKGSVDDRTNYYALTRRGKRELAADRAWRTGGSA